MSAVRARLVTTGAFCVAAALAACSHADYAPIVLASPSASASATPSATPSSAASSAPQVCATAAPGAVYVAMGSYIEPHADATYGIVYGFVQADAQGNYPLSAAPVAVRVGQNVQFVNVDPVDANGSGTAHSAVGLQQNGFPTSTTFPPAALGPVGAALSATALWSTGLVAAGASALCYSQTFAAPAPGTYYFGDELFYASVNERDVVVVSP